MIYISQIVITLILGVLGLSLGALGYIAGRGHTKLLIEKELMEIVAKHQSKQPRTYNGGTAE